MKKIKLLALLAFSAMLFAACNNNTDKENTGTAESSETASHEEDKGLFDSKEENEIEIDEVDEDAVESAKSESDNYQLGEPVEIDGITVIINDAFMTEERNDTNIIDVSGVLVLDITYENGTDQIFPAGRDITLEADGELAHSYELDSIFPADLAPGESITGQMSYGLVSVPENMVAVFEPLMNSVGETAVFDIVIE